MSNRIRIAFLFALIGLAIGYFVFARNADGQLIAVKELMQNILYDALKKRVISMGGIGALVGFGISAILRKK